MNETKQERKDPKNLPDWLKVELVPSRSYHEIKSQIDRIQTHIVCEDSKCPNLGECWSKKTALVMILGDICTRRCDFCPVTTGVPPVQDINEPADIARLIKRLGLNYAVIASVARDDLPDRGASAFRMTIQYIRSKAYCKVEVLTPDYLGDDLSTIINASPDVFGHNLETVERIFPLLKHEGSYQRSLDVLGQAKEISPEQRTKSGIMIGLGETREEILQTMWDLRWQDVDYVSIGQYIQPTRQHPEVQKYYTPDEFLRLKTSGQEMGFAHVESGPLVRSSYRAERALQEMENGI